MNKDRIIIAVQKKGRLSDASMAFLKSLGIEFAPNENYYIQKCKDRNIDLLLLRDDDIPLYVNRGIADFAIIGENIKIESGFDVEVIREFDFAKCSLVIAVPKNSPIKKPSDLEGERIATSYPQLLKNYLAKNNINATIIPIAGSVEISPELNLADAICDITQTGETLKAHGLKPIITILESKALLITNDVVKNWKQATRELLLK